MADALLADLSSLESPAPMGFIVDLPAAAAFDPHAASVVLDRVQDAGNVGSIPVSYTHLDVYKRQRQDLACVCFHRRR